MEGTDTLLDFTIDPQISFPDSDLVFIEIECHAPILNVL